MILKSNILKCRKVGPSGLLLALLFPCTSTTELIIQFLQLMPLENTSTLRPQKCQVKQDVLTLVLTTVNDNELQDITC
jgi:hypothetical protein